MMLTIKNMLNDSPGFIGWEWIETGSEPHHRANGPSILPALLVGSGLKPDGGRRTPLVNKILPALLVGSGLKPKLKT